MSPFCTSPPLIRWCICVSNGQTWPVWPIGSRPDSTNACLNLPASFRTSVARTSRPPSAMACSVDNWESRGAARFAKPSRAAAPGLRRGLVRLPGLQREFLPQPGDLLVALVQVHFQAGDPARSRRGVDRVCGRCAPKRLPRRAIAGEIASVVS